MIPPPPISTLFPYTTLFRSAFYDNPNALRDYFRDIGRMVLAAEGRKNHTRSEERFSRNAETDLVCRLLLEKKKKKEATDAERSHYHARYTRHTVNVESTRHNS